MTDATDTLPSKAGDVVVVERSSIGGDVPFLATVEAYNGKRCSISYMAPNGSRHIRDELTGNLHLASHEERLCIPVIGQPPAAVLFRADQFKSYLECEKVSWPAYFDLTAQEMAMTAALSGDPAPKDRP